MIILHIALVVGIFVLSILGAIISLLTFWSLLSLLEFLYIKLFSKNKSDRSRCDAKPKLYLVILPIYTVKYLKSIYNSLIKGEILCHLGFCFPRSTWHHKRNHMNGYQRKHRDSKNEEAFVNSRVSSHRNNLPQPETPSKPNANKTN